MAGKVIDDSASGVLILIIPFALASVLLFTAWPLVLVLVLLGGALNVWQRYQWLKWSQQLNPIFHQLIQSNQGCLTALDLAMKANISGTAAKRFLDVKAKEFGIRAISVEDKVTVYYFTTGSTLNSLLDSSETGEAVAIAPSTTAAQTLVEPPVETEQPEPEPSTPQEQTPVEVSVETAPSEAEPLTPQEQTPVEVSVETAPSEAEPLTLQEQTPVAAPEETAPSEAEQSTAEADTPTEALSEAPPPQQQQPSESQDEELEPVAAEKSPKKLMAFGSLIQIELANRLGVHSSTVYKHRYDADFPEWSKSRDPEGIAWEYSEDTKEFYPVETK